MANVQLPSISTTPGDIDNASLPELQKIVKGLLNTTVILTEELTFLLNNLDTRNVNELNAEVIVAGSITAEQIAAKSITADKMLVNELSAITAKLGKITSGEIYGAYIATRENAYPRSEMSNTSDMFGAFKTASNSVQIYSPVERLSPVVKLETGGVTSYIFYDPSDNKLSVTSNYADINVSTNGSIELYASQVKLIDWSTLINNTTGRTLAQDLGL